uniref:Small nuclear ribonucleoprotein Sm D3 n=1 Tax=Ditylenchus dipsaci TaxID=166011 RepID=A0A915D3Y3_9BILA
MTAIGVPIKILHEAEGHIITLETVIGEVYRGKLVEAEDNMNCQMADVTVTLRDGRTHTLDNVFVRGSSLRFVILPDMLKNAPMFKNIGERRRVHMVWDSVAFNLRLAAWRGSAFRGGVRGRGGAVRGRGGPFRG